MNHDPSVGSKINLLSQYHHFLSAVEQNQVENIRCYLVLETGMIF